MPNQSAPSIAALALRLDRISFVITYLDKDVPPDVVVELLGQISTELRDIDSTGLEEALGSLPVDLAYEKVAAALAIGELAANCDHKVVIDLEPRPFAVRFNDSRTRQRIEIIRDEVK